MLKYFIVSTLLIISSASNAQTAGERNNLEIAFRSLDHSSRGTTQSQLQHANLYHQAVDGFWGNGTESALLAAFHTLTEFETGVSLRSVPDAAYFLDFIIAGSAQKFIYGEANECDGCATLETSAQSESVVASNGFPEWILVPALPHNASIGQWINASDATRLSTAGNFFAQARVSSNNQLSKLVRSGAMLEYARNTVACTNNMINFGLQTGQKRRSSRVSDMIRVCVFN